MFLFVSLVVLHESVGYHRHLWKRSSLAFFNSQNSSKPSHFSKNAGFERTRFTFRAEQHSQEYSNGQVMAEPSEAACSVKAEQDIIKSVTPKMKKEQRKMSPVHADISSTDLGARADLYNLCGFSIRAISVGGFETCIQFPSMSFAFDIGRCPSTAIPLKTIFFTHGHMDHIGGIAFHAASRSMHRLASPVYVVPPHLVKGLEAVISAHASIDESNLPSTVVPIDVGQSYDLPNRLSVRPFLAMHTVRTHGYVVYSLKQKLKAEFLDTPGQEIKRMREAGIEVTDRTETPEICFSADSLIDIVDRYDFVRNARLLIMECTFVDDTISVKEARSKGHIHIDEIVRRADLFKNERILLTHFSARYTADTIVKALNERLPPSLRERVVPCLTGFR